MIFSTTPPNATLYSIVNVIKLRPDLCSLKTEFVAEAEKKRMTLNPIPGTTLHNMIVEDLSMIRGYVAGKSQSRYLYNLFLYS